MLLFDDDIQILEVCTMILEFAGYTVVTSANVVDVVAQVTTANPDVIIMDNWIPDIGGIRATQLIKQHLKLVNIPVVYISANSNIEILSKEAGADCFLAKPFNIDQLEKVIGELITKC